MEEDLISRRKIVLAERAQAELDGRDPDVAVARVQEPRTSRERRRQMRKNAERTRRLAEKGQAELDRRARRREAG
jgi:hypothetical protein